MVTTARAMTKVAGAMEAGATRMTATTVTMTAMAATVATMTPNANGDKHNNQILS